MASNEMDWQIGLRHISQRANKILDTGIWSDCVFIVGTENRQETVLAHKLILAMASPVFEAMFYGSMADKENKPIEILDVQPQAFQALLKYIYADELNLTSLDQVCEICYAAKKYMIPPLVEKCTNVIWRDLHPGNVCRAYAFVRLFEEPQLLEKCMNMIKRLAQNVIKDQSFEDVDISTLKAILTEDELEVSEINLWEGVLRWSKQECARQSLEPTPPNQRKVIQDLLPLIRFLVMSPTQFANGPALTSILSQEECFSLLMNISSPGVAPMLPNFSTTTTRRKYPFREQQYVQEGRQHSVPVDLEMEDTHDQCVYFCHCAGPLADIFINEQLVDCSLSFSIDRDIRIVGVILPTQLRPQGMNPDLFREADEIQSVQRPTHQLGSHPMLLNKYPELIYAFLQDGRGSRLTYTHFSARSSWESTMEVLFNRPIVIVPNMPYKIVVVLNKMGRYPLYSTLTHVLTNNVNFEFGSRESIVKTILFKSFGRPSV